MPPLAPDRRPANVSGESGARRRPQRLISARRWCRGGGWGRRWLGWNGNSEAFKWQFEIAELPFGVQAHPFGFVSRTLGHFANAVFVNPKGARPQRWCGRNRWNRAHASALPTCNLTERARDLLAH